MSLRLDLPRAKGLFVTGTDTGVGKSVVAGGIARLVSRGGKRVGVFKPVASGCRREREGLVSSDAEFLSFCSETEAGLSLINPVSYATPAAPSVCAEYEGYEVSYEQIAVAYKNLCKVNDFIIVEGIGGALVPLSEGETILDLAVEMGLGVVIVARPNLGTINHTLMTIACVRAAGLRVVGVVINGYKAKQADIAEESAGRVISGFGQTNVLAVLPFDEKTNVEGCRLGGAVLECLGVCDWLEAGGG